MDHAVPVFCLSVSRSRQRYKVINSLTLSDKRYRERRCIRTKKNGEGRVARNKAEDAGVYVDGG